MCLGFLKYFSIYSSSFPKNFFASVFAKENNSGLETLAYYYRSFDDEVKKKIKIKCLIEIHYSTGLRESELINLNASLFCPS